MHFYVISPTAGALAALRLGAPACVRCIVAYIAFAQRQRVEPRGGGAAAML